MSRANQKQNFHSADICFNFMTSNFRCAQQKRGFVIKSTVHYIILYTQLKFIYNKATAGPKCTRDSLTTIYNAQINCGLRSKISPHLQQDTLYIFLVHKNKQ